MFMETLIYIRYVGLTIVIFTSMLAIELFYLTVPVCRPGSSPSEASCTASRHQIPQPGVPCQWNLHPVPNPFRSHPTTAVYCRISYHSTRTAKWSRGQTTSPHPTWTWPSVRQTTTRITVLGMPMRAHLASVIPARTHA